MDSVSNNLPILTTPGISNSFLPSSAIQHVDSQVPEPAIPPRPSVEFQSTASASYYPSYSSSSYLNSFGNNYYSAYNNPYSYQRPYGFGLGGFGSNPAVVDINAFNHVIDQHWHQTFGGVENAVSAFASIATMLDSCMQALRAGVQAALGLADQFSRLRTLFAGLAIVQFLRRLVGRLLGLKWTKEESAWSTATAFAVDSKKNGNNSNWTTGALIALVIGVPWLLWKLVQRLLQQSDNDRRWMRGADEHWSAIATHAFAAGRQSEMSICAGQQLRVAPKHLQPEVRGWLLASDGERCGLVPANHVKLLAKRQQLRDASNSCDNNSLLSSANT